MENRNSETVVKCSGKAEYMQYVKKSIMQFAEDTSKAPEVYGAMCVVDYGDSAQIYQLGNEASLRDIQGHILKTMGEGKLRGSPTKVVKLNAYGIAIAIFGLGILVGLVL
jgi:hypothetical protein